VTDRGALVRCPRPQRLIEVVRYIYRQAHSPRNRARSSPGTPAACPRSWWMLCATHDPWRKKEWHRYIQLDGNSPPNRRHPEKRDRRFQCFTWLIVH
jgi:hypothetical protein